MPRPWYCGTVSCRKPQVSAHGHDHSLKLVRQITHESDQQRMLEDSSASRSSGVSSVGTPCFQTQDLNYHEQAVHDFRVSRGAVGNLVRPHSPDVPSYVSRSRLGLYPENKKIARWSARLQVAKPQ